MRAHFVFEMPFPASERCLPLIPLLHPNLMVRVAHVYLGEDFGAMQPVQHFRYEGKGATVFDCNLVESPVVDHQTQFAIAFSKHDWYYGAKGSSGVA